MGLFKQLKQMKETVHEAPDLVRGAMEMQREAQAVASAQVAAATGAGGQGGPGEPEGASIDEQEIANVSLARYAGICRTGSDRGVTDLPGVSAVAAEFGVSGADWDAAVAGWNARFTHDTSAAMRFNALWRGVG